MAIGLETTLTSIASFLQGIAPVISIILIILGGITYGLAQTQPADSRGKWQNAAVNLVIGGVIIGAIVGAAGIIQGASENLLK